MGNCCGSESTSDYEHSTSAYSRPQKARVSGPGHTLGGPPAEASAGADPRTAAALAAEVYSFLPLMT